MRVKLYALLIQACKMNLSLNYQCAEAVCIHIFTFEPKINRIWEKQALYVRKLISRTITIGLY